MRALVASAKRMRVALGSDHHGVALKASLIEALEAEGHEPVDMGPNSDEAVDYPDFAAKVAQAVGSGDADRGVLICGSGVGMAITANKFDGVRAVNAHDVLEAEMSRRHNDANLIALAASRISPEQAQEILSTFLSTEFEGGRHERRVEEIAAIETRRSNAPNE